MNRNIKILGLALLSIFGTGGCQMMPNNENARLVGAWKGHVQFTTGSYAAIKDLELMYAFNQGGTMSESSNYDES